MALFTIEEGSCTRCGICAAECPGRIVAQEGKSVPVPAPQADEFCIGCAHCVAVCPTDSFRHSYIPVESCAQVKPELVLDLERAEQFLKSRRSIRTFKADPVPRETLLKLIEIASHAPTASNSQTVQWRVVYGADDVQKLIGHVVDWMRYAMAQNPVYAERFQRILAAWENGIDRICRSAPHLIVAHAPSEANYSMTDCAIATAYLELAAPALGLGSCWGGYFTSASKVWQPLREALGIPEGNACFGTLMVGFPKYRFRRLAQRKAPQVSWY